MAKEKLNLFKKGQNKDLDEIYEKFGVDYYLLSMFMYREADEEGQFHIRWGEQNIATEQEKYQNKFTALILKQISILKQKSLLYEKCFRCSR